ncbi:DUF5915 domain-containing protein, partial [Streptomyces sp. ET3-23]|uniref:DUF5915 domain-containing protein n=1 Tax=Streptomyces sp. ET3-23 TaxID=2885643 RepID=UPI001D11EBB8
VASDSGATVALDLEITPELKRAGLARDAIRLIQEARKNSGFEVTDRITVQWQASAEETATALAEHATLIADEVLAVGFDREAVDAGGTAVRDESLGLAFRLQKA